MRYEKGHKDATRRHILDVAAKQFRENGVAAAGLAGIMSDAGLTNGAFYAHFDSKEDLLREVLLDLLTRRKQQLRVSLENKAPLEPALRDYLSPGHRENAGYGCPAAALASEIARHPKKTREAFSENIRSIIALIAEQMHGAPQERRRSATATFAMMVGALQLARVVSDKKQSDEILQAAIAAALKLAGSSRDKEQVRTTT